MALATRSRISGDFLKANTCERVLTGTAKAIAEHGYKAAKIADIVKACRTSRKTFYDCFGGKEQAALALVAEFEIEGLSEAHSLDLLLIEVAAFHRAGETERASHYLGHAESVIRFFAESELEPPPISDDLRATLPPGRHSLPRHFVRANQRARLLEGTAAAIVGRGFLAVRISDVTTQAALSRRTFYEHLTSFDDAAQAMIDAAVRTDLRSGLASDSGLYAVAAEIAACRLIGGDPAPFACKALSAVYALAAAFEARSQ